MPWSYGKEQIEVFMKIRPGCSQHIGVRNEQQDSFAFSHIEDTALVRRAGIMAVVADGMGGMAMGRESGDTAVKATLTAHEASPAGTDPIAILCESVKSANRDVLNLANNAGVLGNAGSTLVAVIIKDNNLYWTSVGDSRIYLYRSGELVQLNTEQNFAAELMQRVAAGELSQEEALNHPDRAALTNFIGNSDLKQADANQRPFQILNGDWLVLCSDGLFGTLDDDEIREELYGNPNDACERLVKKTIAMNKSHQDNVTVVILACGDREPITVKSKKKERLEVFQPLPAKKNRTPLILTLVVACMLLVAGAILYPSPRKKNTQHPVPAISTVTGDSGKKTQKQHSSGRRITAPTINRENER
jgi:protein phosphatase